MMISFIFWYCEFVYHRAVVSFMDWRVKQLRKKYFFAEEIRRTKAGAFRAKYTPILKAAKKALQLKAAKDDYDMLEGLMKKIFKGIEI
ncbi:MAG: hypothetical protein OEW04_03520 [Nitrospirota bacterium]|nr:hypothetical protein [Nitrospirota bacterium]